MGTKELEALIAVLERETKAGREGHALGTWTIRYDKSRSAFSFDYCESEVYCNERPAVIGVEGDVIDPGGPIEF